MNLPPDSEGLLFNGGTVAKLTWDPSLQEKAFSVHRLALNKYSYLHGIHDHSMGNAGDGRASKWKPSSWVSFLAQPVYERISELQVQVAKHDAVFNKMNKSYAYFYDEKIDDLVYIDVSRLSPESCPFENVSWGSEANTLDANTPDTNIPRRPYLWKALLLAASLACVGFCIHLFIPGPKLMSESMENKKLLEDTTLPAPFFKNKD